MKTERLLNIAENCVTRVALLDYVEKMARRLRKCKDREEHVHCIRSIITALGILPSVDEL